jgi:hypothetical protein
MKIENKISVREQALNWWKNLPLQDLRGNLGWANLCMKYYPEKTDCQSLTEKEIEEIWMQEEAICEDWKNREKQVQEHTSEPWINNCAAFIESKDGIIIAQTFNKLEENFENVFANAQRIVDCVNSCKNVSKEWLRSNSVQVLIEEKDRIEKIKKEAIHHLEWILEEFDNERIPSEYNLGKVKEFLKLHNDKA